MCVVRGRGQSFHRTEMCVNTASFGAAHMFMLVSGVVCILVAVVGQLCGCSASMAASGVLYECSPFEDALFFFNNAWQATVWATLMAVTVELRPSREKIVTIFTPFILLAVVMIVFSALNPMGDASTPAATIGYTVATFLWFGLFGYAVYAHKEPSSCAAIYAL